MGSFEKLGILVIVVIIVMILAVAVYQWGGDAGEEEEYPILEPGTPSVIERDLGEPRTEDGLDPPDLIVRPPAPASVWSGDVPKRYTVKPNDNLWDLVFKEWRLREGFIDEVKRANPGVNWKRLRPGRELVIPDPGEYVRGGSKEARSVPATRRYRIQVGDTLELIAKKHLGSKNRWHEIRDLNPGLRPERLRPGQEIHIPIR